jgi:hypothetical protein
MAESRGVLGSPAIFDVIPSTLPPSSAGCGTVRGLDRLRAAAEGAVLAYGPVPNSRVTSRHLRRGTMSDLPTEGYFPPNCPLQ